LARLARDPILRFSDVEWMLQDAITSGSFRLEMESRGVAVNTVHRINLYRRFKRELADTPTIPEDMFVVRAVGKDVQIAPRPMYDRSKATTIDGRPLTPRKNLPFEETNKQRIAINQPPLTLEQFEAIQQEEMEEQARLSARFIDDKPVSPGNENDGE
jgi:hypothetical protein